MGLLDGLLGNALQYLLGQKADYDAWFRRRVADLNLPPELVDQLAERAWKAVEDIMQHGSPPE